MGVNEERAAQTQMVLDSLGIEFFLDSGVLYSQLGLSPYPYDPSTDEELAFEEELDGDGRITRGDLKRFYEYRFHRYHYVMEEEMQDWSFYVFEHYLERLNQEIDDETPAMIRMIDLYNWVEHCRLIHFHNELELLNNFDRWKKEFDNRYYNVPKLFHSL